MKILVVDDDDLIRELLVEILTAHGYEDITQANSGEDGLAKVNAAQDPFDCFMFDIQMPGMDGIELCAAVRAIDFYKDTPVIMITAMNNQDYVGRAFTAGATDYVTKPFDMTELMTRIRLADRLQAETRKAAQAVLAAPANAVKAPFSTPVVINEIKGFVNSAILENYVMINLEQKHFPMTAVAIQVPELAAVHDGASEDEFNYVLLDVAEVISDTMARTQAFLTYVGNGVFLIVGNKARIPDDTTLRETLLPMLNDEQYVFCEDVQTAFTVNIGERSSPKLLDRRGDLRFLERAVENLNGAGAGAAGKAKFISRVKTAFAA
ncbi:MAG: response regulator [Brevirhabdus sp.]